VYEPDAELASRFLSAIWGEREGWVCLGWVNDRLAKEAGRRATIPAVFYRWPESRDKIVTAAARQTEQGYDVYFCPSFMTPDQDEPDGQLHRMLKYALPGDWAWVDVDKPSPGVANRLAELGAVVINSGGPGHVHGWVPLTRVVPKEELRAINLGLVKEFGGDPAPTHAAPWMRLPGTLRWKGGEQCSPVTLHSWPVELRRHQPTDLPQVSSADSPASTSYQLGERSYLPSVGELIRDGLPWGAGDDTLFRVLCRERTRLISSGVEDHSETMRERLIGLARQINNACVEPMDDGRVLAKVESALRQDRTNVTQGEGTDGDRPTTETGNALRFVDAYGSSVRYVPQWGWLVYDGQVWKPDELAALRLARSVPSNVVLAEAQAADPGSEKQATLIKWHFRSQSSASITATEKLARTDLRIAAEPDDFNAAPYLLPVANGLLDLRNRSVKPYYRGAPMFTSQVEVEYDPTARDPRWDYFVRSVTHQPGTGEGSPEHVEYAAYLRRALGYTLTGETSEEVFFLAHGNPAAGKSTLLDVLFALLGRGFVHGASESLIVESRRGNEPPLHEVAQLAGRRLIFLEDLGPETRLRDTLVKSLTSGGLLTGRPLYKSSFNFHPTGKLWIATNRLPHTADIGTWRRMRALPFDNAQRNPDLTLKMYLVNDENAQRAALRWLVDGAADWYANGLGTCERVREATNEYKESEDRIGQFIAEECVVGGGKEVNVTFQDIYDRFRIWMTARGERPWSAKALASDLHSRAAELNLEVNREMLDGQKVRLWKGITLVPRVATWQP
jgi:putative DNA primase/helicase